MKAEEGTNKINDDAVNKNKRTGRGKESLNNGTKLILWRGNDEKRGGGHLLNTLKTLRLSSAC